MVGSGSMADVGIEVILDLAVLGQLSAELDALRYEVLASR